ncbi:hypothetical protein NUSPORA_01398 [Nucleospora cyclopteri]
MPSGKIHFPFYTFLYIYELLLFVASFLISKFFLKVIEYYLELSIDVHKPGNKRVFLFNMVYDYSSKIALVMAIGLFSFGNVINAEYKLLENLTQIEAQLPSCVNYFGKPTTYFISYRYSLFNKAFMIFFVFLLKDFLIYSLNYSIKNKTYYKKLATNSIKLDLIEKLNKLVNSEVDDTIELVVSKLISDIGRDDGMIYYTETAAKLGEKDTEILFAFADPTGDMRIATEELLGFYKKTFSEQDQLENSIHQTNVSLDSLGGALNFVCFSIIFFVILSTNQKSIKERSVAYVTTLISGSYIFSDTLKKFINSIAFVFCIRIYDVDDIVIIENKMYKVKMVNLLSTIFQSKNLTTSITNDILYKYTITNLSISESMEENYVLRFNDDAFKAKSPGLLKQIKTFYKSHRAMFTKKPYFSNIQIEGNGIIQVELIVNYTLKFQELNVIERRRNAFVLSLSDMLTELDLKAM